MTMPCDILKATLPQRRVCEFSQANISCPSGKIFVTGAFYGRKSRTACPYKGRQRVDSKYLKNTRCDLGSQGQCGT